MGDLRAKLQQLPRTLGARLWEERLFVGLSLVFLSFPLTHLGYVPIWDGWEFFRRCYQGAAEASDFRCFGHSAQVPSALFSLTQLVDDGNHWLVTLLSTALGLTAVGFFRALIGRVAGLALSGTERTLLAFGLGLWPVFQAQLVQPSLDYPMAVFYVAFLWALLGRRHISAAVLGLAMMFSKEPGMVLYGASAGLYGVLLAFEKPHGFRLGTIWRQRIWVLVLPVVAMAVSVLVFPPQSDAGSWKHVLEAVFTFNPDSTFLHSQLLSAFVINFAWLVSGIAVLGLLARPVLARLGKAEEGVLAADAFSPRCLIFVGSTLLALTYFLTRIDFANNPRYMLPVVPLLLLLAGHGMALVPWKKIRLGVLVVLLGLLVGSTYRTFDPVARAAVGTFRFGEHTMLSMAQPANQPRSGHGRDQIVYNGQFTMFSTLTEMIVQRYGLTAIYVADHRMTWTGFAGLRSFDDRTRERTLRRGLHTRPVSLLVRPDFEKRYGQRSAYPKEIFFIAYPNMRHNREVLGIYLRDYRIAATETFEDGGYAIDVHRLLLE